MCLIMTIVAAVVFTVLFVASKKRGAGSKSVFTTMLMFWAASLMWSVDGIASVLEGEGFFDISVEDTILGVIILAAGLVVFAALSAKEKFARKANA